MFYNFVRNMWISGTIDEAKVRSYAPKYITAEQADTILATPQK